MPPENPAEPNADQNQNIDQQPQVIEPEHSSTPQSQPDQPKKNSNHKKWLIPGVLLLILLGAGGAYHYYSQNNKTADNSPHTTPAIHTQNQATPLADNVIYYSSDKPEGPYTIYLRPAGGGDRKAVMTLSKNYSVNMEVRGQNAVFATNDGIYASQDGGKTFKNVYKLDPAKAAQNQAITSVGFSTDNKKIVFALLPGIAGTNTANTVKAMGLDGQNVTDLNTSDKAGVFVYSYDPIKQQLVYATGCYFCDGGPGYPHLLNLKTKADKQAIETPADSLVYTYGATSQDGKKLVYVLGTNDKQVQEQIGGIGWPGAPPYKVMQYDTTTGETTQLTTIGTLHEKAADGTYKTYYMQFGYTNDSQEPYYFTDNKLYLLKAGAPSLLFEAEHNIQNMPYVSAKEIIAAVADSDKATTSYTLYHYDISTKKTAVIYQRDDSTYAVVIGVTTK